MAKPLRIIAMGARLLARAALYLSTLFLLLLLVKGGLNLIVSFSVPLEFSTSTRRLLSIMFILPFIGIGLLMIINIFKSTGS